MRKLIMMAFAATLIYGGFSLAQDMGNVTKDLEGAGINLSQGMGNFTSTMNESLHNLTGELNLTNKTGQGK